MYCFRLILTRQTVIAAFLPCTENSNWGRVFCCAVKQKILHGLILFKTDIYIFTGGIPSDGNLEDFTVGTGGKHYFKMRSYEHLEEAFDQNFGESSLPWRLLLALLHLTQSCRFHNEDEDEARVLCGLHKPYNSHDRDSNRSMYPWAVTVIVLANVMTLFHSSLSSSSAWRSSTVITTIMLLVLNLLIPFRNAPALWWRLSLCWLLPTASPLKFNMRALWLTLTANCGEVERKSAWIPLDKQIPYFPSSLNLYMNSKSLLWSWFAAVFPLIAKRVWIHPLYVRTRIALGASHFYDYDAALIQLMEDVVVSTAVRWEMLPLQLCLLSLKVKKPKSSCRLTGWEILSGSWTIWKCSLLEQHLRLSKNDEAQVFFVCHWTKLLG